jgi:hypothetical protein
VSPGGTAGGLSGGAIAGIVVGTLAGVALLLLLCACCVVRGLWHGLLALLGIRKKKETKTVIEEERYTRHGRREGHGSWYGGRPSTAASRKEKSKGAGLLGIGAALGTLALLLGLRRDKKKKAATKTRSDFSSSSWSESYTASDPSEYPPLSFPHPDLLCLGLLLGHFTNTSHHRLFQQRQTDPALRTGEQGAEQGDEDNPHPHARVEGAIRQVTQVAQMTC